MENLYKPRVVLTMRFVVRLFDIVNRLMIKVLWCIRTDAPRLYAYS